jgi:hypothetical protein
MERTDEERDGVPVSTLVGVGCFTAFVGAFGGGMIAVFLGKIVGSIRGCEPPEGVPACNWHLFAGVGMVIGFVVVPTMSIIRLKGRRSI